MAALARGEPGQELLAERLSERELEVQPIGRVRFERTMVALSGMNDVYLLIPFAALARLAERRAAAVDAAVGGAASQAADLRVRRACDSLRTVFPGAAGDGGHRVFHASLGWGDRAVAADRLPS